MVLAYLSSLSSDNIMKLFKGNSSGLKFKGRVGWVIPQKGSYATVMASTRIRVYDVIKYMGAKGYSTGLYNRLLSYQVVVFQKTADEGFVELAEKLKSKGVKVGYDININMEDNYVHGNDQDLKKYIRLMSEVADFIIVTTDNLKDYYSKINDKTFVIEEMVDDKFGQVKKNHMGAGRVNLLYCGYAAKAKELFLIEGVLRKLYSRHKIGLVIISDKDPEIDLIPYKYLHYDYANLEKLFLEGDIKISPRDMSKKYNHGHAFTKIGYPMAAGLPVVASPVPSYSGSPAFLCSSDNEWEECLEKLIIDASLRNSLGQQGRAYVRDHFSRDIIIGKYIDLFSDIVNN